MGSGLHALQIVAVAGIDAHLIADIAEERHADFSAGLHGSGLERVGGGVALDAGFGVGDFKHHVGGKLAGEDRVGSGVNHSLDDIALLEELNAFDAFAGKSHLLERLGVHEVVAHIVFIEILIGTALDADFVDFHAGVPGLVEDTAGFYVAKLCAYESRTLTGLNVKEFHDEEIVAVDVEAHAVLEISCCCHKKFWIVISCIIVLKFKR